MLNYIGDKLAKFLGEEMDVNVASPINEAVYDFMRANSISEVLPYFTYDEKSKIFVNKHSYGFVLEMSPLIGFTKKVESELSGIFKTIMPSGSNLQFLMFASPKVGTKIDHWQNARLGASEVLRDLAKKRADFFRGFAFSSSKVRNFRLFMSCSFEQGGNLSEYQKKEARELREAVSGTFETIGMPCMVMNPEELIPVLNSILAPKKDLYSRSYGWNKTQSISDQISHNDTSLQVKQKGLLIDEGEFLIRNYTAIGFPGEWYLGAMDLLIGDTDCDLLQIECPFMIAYSIHFVSDKTLQTKLTAKGGRVESQASSPLAKWLPGLVRQADEWRFVREQIESKERLVRTSYQVALFSSPENIARDEQRLMSLYRSNDFELVCNRYVQLPCLVSMLPMSWGAGVSHDMVTFKQSRVTLSHEPINLLPIQGEWKGTKTPGVLFTSRKGQIFTWSPFDSEGGNYNVVVAGESGTGKSFAVQVLIESILGLGGRAFVLDLGKSFSKFCKKLGGDIIEFSTTSNICLNPFTSVPTGSEKETKNALKTIKSIAVLMATPKEEISNIEYGLLGEAIFETWNRKNTKATMADVIIELEKMGDKRAKDLSRALYPYGAKGEYAPFFEGESNIDFKSALNVVELGELKEDKDLQAVVFRILQSQIANKMTLGDRTTPWGLVIEEAWDQFEGKDSVDFVSTQSRTIRKTRGSLISVTQGVDDFYSNPAARAVFDNATWKLLLFQTPEAIKQLKRDEKLAMSEHEENTLNSLQTIPGQYSEMLIKGRRGSAVGRLMADPFSRILYSTEPREHSRVEALQKQGLSLTDAVTQTAREVFGEEVV